MDPGLLSKQQSEELLTGYLRRLSIPSIWQTLASLSWNGKFHKQEPKHLGWSEGNA
jgi:hypothetical protein